MVSVIKGGLNQHDIYNDAVEFHPSYSPFESNSESVPDLETTLIKSIDDDEMDHILELIHPENDDDLLDVDL